MTQLVINGIVLPETTRDKYSCYPEQLSRQIDMISGRRVNEYRGSVYKISYTYDYMGNELARQVLSVLRSGNSFPVSFLSDEEDTMLTGTFLTESITSPTFAFSKGGKPYWHNFSFVLREVKPHD